MMIRLIKQNDQIRQYIKKIIRSAEFILALLIFVCDLTQIPFHAMVEIHRYFPHVHFPMIYTFSVDDWSTMHILWAENIDCCWGCVYLAALDCNWTLWNRCYNMCCVHYLHRYNPNSNRHHRFPSWNCYSNSLNQHKSWLSCHCYSNTNNSCRCMILVQHYSHFLYANALV